MANTLHNRRILLIISGGIAAYKSLDLIRRLREQGAAVRCVLTQGGSQFVTQLSVSALSEDKVYGELWSLTDEAQMGHIRLSREADLVLVAPATANLIGKMAQGLADDLASTVLLATDKPVMIAPAMNVMMWEHASVQDNIKILKRRGIGVIAPGVGSMACGETGEGRMAEVADIVEKVSAHFAQPGKLSGRRALVTSGPTFEPIDPVRFIGNRSSGKQGMPIAEALMLQGAETILVTGPTHLADPKGIQTVHVETAEQMLAAVEASLPVDIAVCAAAVSDWRAEQVSSEKLKKGAASPQLKLIENPDILARIANAGNRRPRLVVGFAAETNDMIRNASDKLARKGCDWLLANEVGAGRGFDQDDNEVTLLRRDAKGAIAASAWPQQSKIEIARQLADEIAKVFAA
jgi:phosphopantothenoylcysteine decarboxylase/phosphopantothenate--cysteine ligase